MIASPTLMAGRHLPPSPDAGDESTLGGYTAVHARPPAFEGPDGVAYSVGVCVDDIAGAAVPDESWGAYLIFVRWRRIGESAPDGHLETGYLLFAATEREAHAGLGALSLVTVQETLDRLVRARDMAAGDGGSTAPARRWWDAMRDSTGEPDA